MKNRILKVRKENHLTQDSFAEKLNLSKNFVWMLEKGERVPSDRTISDICTKFGINEEWLRTGNGEMKADVDIDFGSICADIGVNDQKAKEAIMKYYELTEEDKNLWWAWMEKFLNL